MGSSGCAKAFLFVFNVIFWLGGAGLLGIGIWMKIDNTIVNYLEITNIDGSDPLVNHAALIFIIAGGVTFLVGGLGCFGAIRESQMLLFWYAFLLILLLAAEAVAGVLALVYRSKVESHLHSAMVSQIQNDYVPGTATKGAWDYLQYSMKCCGTDNVTDYEGSTWWNTHRQTINRTEQVVPSTCCVLSNEDHLNPMPVNWMRCQKDAKAIAENSQFYHSIGCHEMMLTWFQTNSLILMLVGFAVGASQLVGVAAACCLRQALKHQSKAKYQDTGAV